MSKLPAPSVSMPCAYRILQSSTKGQVLLVLLETVARSPSKSNQALDLLKLRKLFMHNNRTTKNYPLSNLVYT